MTVPNSPTPSAVPSPWNIPNFLSVSRLVAAPVLLLLAWQHMDRAFLYVLSASLVTDILDGKIARWLGQTSEFGARLDSWADLATYTSVPICATWLRPDLIVTEAPFFWAMVAAYAVPVAIGFAKFGSLTSYHTRGAVVSAYLLGGSAVVLFADGPVWPFRVAAAVLVLAELEEIAITLALLRPATNVKNLRRALALRVEQAAQAPETGGKSSR